MEFDVSYDIKSEKLNQFGSEIDFQLALHSIEPVTMESELSHRLSRQILKTLKKLMR